MNCDPIARHYQWMERAAFGRKLEEIRFCFLPEFANARRALVVGDGDGRFLDRLLATCPCIEADYVDCSAKMVALARERAGSARVTYHCLDVLVDTLPVESYDLIATHFFFDCFERDELERVIGRVAAAAPRAQWLVSEFRIPTSWSVPSWALLWSMYQFFGIAANLKNQRLVDHRPSMEAAGFRLKKQEPRAGGLLVSELWAPEPVE